VRVQRLAGLGMPLLYPLGHGASYSVSFAVTFVTRLLRLNPRVRRPALERRQLSRAVERPPWAN
jgi:hypothetical protein